MKVSNNPIIAVALFAALTISSQALYADESEKQILSPEDQNNAAEQATVKSEVIAKLSIGKSDDATKVELIAIPDESGDFSFGILEENQGNIGLDDFPTLKISENPRELFNAFAAVGALEPAILMHKFAPPKMGKTGWANDLVERMPAVDVASRAACNFASFANSFNSFRPEINGTKRWYSAVNGSHDTATGAFYTHPWAYTWWLNYAANARTVPWNNQYHNYSFYNIDKYKTRVKVCTLKYGNSYQDRYISFRFRRENNSAGVAYFKELTSSNVGTTYSWYWPASSSSSQKNYDWVTLVGGSTVYPSQHPNDRFFVAVQKK